MKPGEKKDIPGEVVSITASAAPWLVRPLRGDEAGKARFVYVSL
jgi:hypothetical protein